jgi:hypothetical protein
VILLAVGLLVAVLVFTAALLTSWATRKAIENDVDELDEQEVARLLYPDGNVALLERSDPDDQISQGRGG